MLNWEYFRKPTELSFESHRKTDGIFLCSLLSAAAGEHLRLSLNKKR